MDRPHRDSCQHNRITVRGHNRLLQQNLPPAGWPRRANEPRVQPANLNLSPAAQVRGRLAYAHFPFTLFWLMVWALALAEVFDLG
jgi:hypothetical protein